VWTHWPPAVSDAQKRKVLLHNTELNLCMGHNYSTITAASVPVCAGQWGWQCPRSPHAIATKTQQHTQP